MTAIKLYNSLTRQKEALEPLEPDHVRMYACGPTVYNYAHIGNARMAVVFDLLARVLRHKYKKVTYVSNITDIEDKIITAAREQGKPIHEITEKYTKIYNDDMAALGVQPPDIQPLATGHIPEMIILMEQLIERGHAYEKDGHVLFNVPSFDNYGGLSGRSRDEQIAGARVEVAPYKKDPADFVLWKPSSGDEPGWNSPFGYGRPGWHIECSAMAEKHLGLPFDIHGGGADLKFPHHENEIAQSCCAHGTGDDLSSFSKLWVHNGFVTVEGEKMSKSLGNVLLVHDLVEDESLNGAVIRMALLSAQYRQPLDWGKKPLEQAQALYDRIVSVMERLNDVEAADTDEVYGPLMEALCDDLNTPLAFSKLGELIKEINKTDPNSQDAQTTLPTLKSVLHNSIEVLGVVVQIGSSDIESGGDFSDDEAAKIEALLTERAEAKTAKNFARADEIRDELAAQGIEIIDTPDGAKWKKK